MKMHATELLTNSRKNCALSCLRKHRIEYELGYRSAVTADALRFGTLIHAGLEAWWRAPLEARLDDALAAIAAGEAEPFDRVRAEVLVTGYHHRWIAEPYETLAVEVEFDTELRNPETGRPSKTWRLGGKLDAVARDMRDGRIVVVEHKTSGEDIGVGSSYWRKLQLDSQVSTYFEGAKALGFEVDAVLYDVIAKSKLRPYEKNSKREAVETPEEFKQRLIEQVAEVPDRFYQRGEVVRLEEERREFLFEVWQQAKLLQESRVAGFAPRNTASCFTWGKPCPYWAHCAEGASLDDTTKFRKLEHVHPELESQS